MFADDTPAYRDEMIDQMPLRIRHRIDGMWSNSYTAIGENAEGRGLVEQVNTEGSKYHCVIGRSIIASNAHGLRGLQGVVHANSREQLYRWHVK